MKKKIICLLISFLVFACTVDAAVIQVSSGQAKASEAEKEATIELSGTDIKDYVKLEFRASVSSEKADIVKVTPFDFKDGKYVYTDSEGLKEGIVGTVIYRTYDGLDADFTINLGDVRLYKEDESYIDVSNSVKVVNGNIKYIAPASTEAYLTSLTISQGTLSPEFDKDTFEYEVNVSDKIQTINVNATAVKGATRTGTGNKSLVLGENTIEIVVTAEDKETTNTYKIVVNRGEVSKPSALIKELKINNVGCKLSPEFDSKNNKYTIDASKDITKISFNYTLIDKNAEVVEDGNEEFTEGENKVTLTVTSSDGEETQVYEFIVNVGEEENTTKTVISDGDDTIETPKSKKWILYVIIVAVVFVVSLVTFLLFRKKKPKNDDKDKTDNNIEEAKTNLYEEEKTTTYDLKTFKDVSYNDDLEKTKEYDINQFRS